MRLYRRDRLPITQIVVFLKQPPAGTIVETELQVGQTRHAYEVVQLWQEPADLFLHDAALLPFATLAATDRPEELLQQVAAQAITIEPERQRREVVASAQILAGLRFSKQVVRQIFRGEAMRESVIYRDIPQEGHQTGLQQGLQQGELNVVLRLLRRRFGELSPNVQTQICSLPIERLELLAEALLDFSQPDDLVNWLQAGIE